MKINQPIARNLLAVAVASALLSACATAPSKPSGADALRGRLNDLQSNAELSSRAPLAIKEADVAVKAAEVPQRDAALAAHLVFMADRKISVAEALGESRLAVDQRKLLTERREAMRLQARTQEADSAKQRATSAQADAADQKQQAESARDANAELQAQIDELQAKNTDRGLVLTLGDVLFAFNTSTLNAGGTAHLVKLAGFLNKYPARSAAIEGYTDSVGSETYNQALSQRRADAVKSYLVAQGIESSRLTSAGKGESSPVSDNTSSSGRQQNRRVEVIIENSQTS